MDPRYLLIGLAASGLILAGTGVARVYQRTGGLASPEAVAAAVDGRLAYRSAVRINGGAGDLSVVSVPDNLHSAARQLRRADGAGAELFLYEGARMNSGLIVHADEIIRLLMFELESPRQCLLLMVRQSPGDFRASRQPPATALLTDAPAYPGSSPVRFWRDLGARMAVEVSRSSDGGDAILGFFRDSLRGSGWIAAMPAGIGTLVFLKGRQICCVSVKGETKSSNLITVLHKTTDN